MTTSTITLNLAASSTSTRENVSRAPVESNAPSGPRVVPASIPTDEAYYWSFRWQTDVRESMAALKAGEYVDFDSDDPNDVARWLLSDDD